MKFPVYRQIEAMDCGPTCIQMIAAYYNKKYSLQTLKDYCTVTRLGISIHDLVKGCEKIGLEAVPLKMSVSRINDLPLPAILYWHQNHFVVLHKIKKKKGDTIYHLCDPSYGRIKLDEEYFVKEWSDLDGKGIAIAIEPKEEFKDIIPPQENNTLHTLKKLCTDVFLKHQRKTILIFILSFATLGTNWFIPVLFQKIIDDGVVGKSINLLIILLLTQLFFFIGNMLSTSLTNIILTRLNLSVGLDMLSLYIQKLTRLPISFFDTKLSTDLIQRIDDQQRIQDYMTSHFVTFFLNILNIIVFLAILLYYNVIIFLFYLILSALALLWVSFFINKVKILDYSRFIISAENKNNIYDLITGMTEVKINSAQQTKLSAFLTIKDKLNKVGIKSLQLNYYITLGSSFINRLKDILIVGFSAYFIITDHLTLGALLSINYILGALSAPLEQMINFIRNTQEVKLSYERLHEIQKKKDEDGSEKILPPSQITSGFVFSKVSFKYQGTFNPFVLEDINITIPKGKVTAIVGTSGSGKTTLLKLLLLFYHPQQGNIYLDDIPFSNINADEWRKKCGVVMQDGYIFSGTIAENIALSHEKINIDKLIKAAKIACIDKFIESLPMKYNTKIGKSGMDISGGQKQRILIARSVYREPEFVFFDEATSSLDANNEMEIMNNMADFYTGRTVIIIAHRLSTVKNADNIILLEHGCVKEQGTHSQLTQLKGVYYSLIKNQLDLGD